MEKGNTPNYLNIDAGVTSVVKPARAASVLLFNCPIIRKQEDVFQLGNLYPRIGIASIAAVLLEHGHQVTVLDPQKETPAAIKAVVKNAHPDIIGIPAFTQEFFDAVYTAQLCKEICPKSLTVLGGPHASAIPEQSLQEGPDFDVAVVREGEMTMLELASGFPLETIPGIAYRQNGRIVVNPAREFIKDLDSLPLPAWQLFDLNKYRGSFIYGGSSKKGLSLELSVEAARGCPFDCYFCFKICHREIHFKSVDRIIADIERDVELFGADRIDFVEGSFGVRRTQAIELCQSIKARGLHEKIKWEVGANFKLLDRELLKMMKEAGCYMLGFGVESGSPVILEKIGTKSTDFKHIEEILRGCSELGIITESCFIIGHPSETEQDVNQTISFARKLKTDYANFAIMVPFPGTQVAEMAEKNVGGLRILTRDWSVYGKQIGAAMELEQLPRKRLLQLQARAYQSFYLTPGRIWSFISHLSWSKLMGIIKRLVNR